MPNRLMMAALCAMLAGPAFAADADLGGVKLKLDPPSAYCELDSAQASDKRMIDFVTASLRNGGIDLLGASADCAELREWRSGKMPFVKHFSQYQISTSRRRTSFPVSSVKSECEELRTQGAKITSDSVASVNEAIRKANQDISVQGATFLGIVGDDPSGCYAAMFQKYKAENGTSVSQLNVFFVGSIKDRSLNFYLWAPYDGDMSTSALLSAAQVQVTKLKAANGL